MKISYTGNYLIIQLYKLDSFNLMSHRIFNQKPNSKASSEK